MILLPTLIVNSKSVDTKFCVSNYIGWSLWLFGMMLECVADYQKYVFRGESANKYVDDKVSHSSKSCINIDTHPSGTNG